MHLPNAPGQCRRPKRRSQGRWLPPLRAAAIRQHLYDSWFNNVGLSSGRLSIGAWAAQNAPQGAVWLCAIPTHTILVQASCHS